MDLITQSKCPGPSVTGSLWWGTGLMRSNENTLLSEDQKLCYGHMQREMKSKCVSISNGHLRFHWADIKHRNPN